MSIDYGPLEGLIGVWRGDQGLDVSPEPAGTEESPYYETLECLAAGDVENYEQQKLVIVSYHQVVTRKRNDEVFHDQLGYWLWDASSQTVMQTLTLDGDRLSYAETTTLKIYDEKSFAHTDANELVRV